MASLASLPLEVALCIFRLLDYRDLLSVAATNTSFRRLLAPPLLDAVLGPAAASQAAGSTCRDCGRYDPTLNRLVWTSAADAKALPPAAARCQACAFSAGLFRPGASAYGHARPYPREPCPWCGWAHHWRSRCARAWGHARILFRVALLVRSAIALVGFVLGIVYASGRPGVVISSALGLFFMVLFGAMLLVHRDQTPYQSPVAAKMVMEAVLLPLAVLPTVFLAASPTGEEAAALALDSFHVLTRLVNLAGLVLVYLGFDLRRAHRSDTKRPADLLAGFAILWAWAPALEHEPMGYGGHERGLAPFAREVADFVRPLGEDTAARWARFRASSYEFWVVVICEGLGGGER